MWVRRDLALSNASEAETHFMRQVELTSTREAGLAREALARLKTSIRSAGGTHAMTPMVTNSSTVQAGETAPPPSPVARLLRGVLTSRPVMAVKQPLNDAWWTIAGRSLTNPPVSGNARSLLFICHGNICRSPFAAAHARQLLAKASRGDVVCCSAGLHANQAASSPPEARAAARRFDVSLDEHTPATLDASLVAGCDLLVVMDARQLAAVRERYPSAAAKTVLLPLFGSAAHSGYARYNIADPFGQPAAAFDACYARIASDLRGLLDAAGLTGQV